VIIDDIPLFVRAMLIGLSIAAPVGPVSLLCIRRTLTDGLAAGLASGMGAATADAVYGIVAGFGLTFVTVLLTGGEFWLRLIGGLYLFSTGVATFLARPTGHAASVNRRHLSGAWASTFVLTLTNPATILAFAAMSGGVGLTYQAHASDPAVIVVVLVSGIFIGSAIWWMLLCMSVSRLRTRLDQRATVWVNRVSGVAIAAIGATAIGSLSGSG
jgi:Putative threonine efflux protein